METYSSFNELMNYFHFNFIVYLMLFLIVLINCLKTLFNYMNVKKDPSADITISPTDIFITMLCGLGFFFGLMFQGVLADISSHYSSIWWPKIFALSIIAFLLFIIQLRFFFLISNILQEKK